MTASMSLTATVVLQMHIENDKFLAQFIAYFDGEKDPRNLMVVFSILRVVMTEWDISSCIQVSRLLNSRPAVYFVGRFRCCIQLLSDHISATARGCVQSYLSRSKGEAENVSRGNSGLCAVRPPGPIRQAGLHIDEHKSKYAASWRLS
jgi:hypothetical protein